MCSTPLDQSVTSIIIIYSTVVDILIDLMIMAMPLKLLYNVQISLRQKLALSGVFSMGMVIVIFSIIRAVQVTTTARNDTFLLAFWGVLESTVAVIVGCLPPFKSLFTNVGSTKGKSGDYYGETGGLGQYGAGSRMRGGGSVPLQSHASIRGGKERWNDDEEYIMNSSKESLTKPQEVDDWALGRIMVKKDVNITTGERPAHAE